MSDKRNMAFLFACGVALLAVAIIGYKVLRGDERADALALIGIEQRTNRATPIDVFLESGAVPVRESHSYARPDGDVAWYGITYSIIDAQVGGAIEYIAKCPIDKVELSMREGGRLLVSAPETCFRVGFPLTITADGYKEKTIRVNTVNECEIAMLPCEVSVVKVLDGVGTVPVVSGRVTAVSPMEGKEIPAALSVLDGGAASIIHAKPVFVTLHNASGATLFSAIVEPGSDLTVEFSSDRTYARLMTVDRTPLSNHPVKCRLSTSAMVELYTDEDGLLSIPESIGGNFELRIESSRFRFLPETQQLDGVVVSGRWLIAEAGYAADRRYPIEVLVEKTVRRLRFVDSDTLDPVSGVAYFVTTFDINGKVESMIDHWDALEDGWMEFGSAFVADASAIDSSAAPSNSVILGSPTSSILVEGYKSHALLQGAQPYSSGFIEDQTVYLERLDQLYWLRVMDGLSSIDAGLLLISKAGSNDPLFVGRVSESMRYGPFDAGGEVIQVIEPRYMDLGAAHLTDETDLTYVLDADQGVGGIRVEGLASFDKTLQCIGSDGRAFSQTYNDGELCMFDRIPPGRYVVGPSEWAKQVFRTPAARKVYSVEVRSMETTVVRAGLAWRLDKPIQGSVVLSPGVKSPLLYLSYAMPVGQIVGQKACIGQVSKSGEYEVPQGQPVPCALIAADFWGGILRVRGVLELGEQRELSERVIVLKGNAVAEDQITVDIQYCYGNTWSRLDVSDSLRSVDFRVVVSNEPISFALHKSVEQLTFRRLVDGKRVTVPVAVGSKQVVDLSKIYEED